MPQALVLASSELDLQAMYMKLKQDADMLSLNFSGGGRGRHDNDCGNLYFQLSSLPKAKFQVSRSGKIQMSIPVGNVDYTLQDCLEKIDEYLVPIDEEKIVDLEPVSDFIVDKPSKFSSLKDFYGALRYELSKELFYVDSILEALDSNKKTVVIVDPSQHFVRLNRGEVIFLGDWAEKAKKEFLDGFQGPYDFPIGDYDVVVPPWLPEDEAVVTALDFEDY